MVNVITRMILGGAQENTLLTCEGLNRSPQWDVTLVTGPALGPEGELINRARRNGVRTVIVPELRRAVHPWRDPVSFARLVEIIRRLRTHGRDVHLHVIGTPDRPKWERQFRAVARRHADWMTLHLNLARSEMVELVAQHRYGLHPMVEEHFGIAPAEMQRAGCVTFAHNSGGPVEIVGGDSRLLFDSAEDATVKIDRVLGDERLQASLRAGVETRKDRFSSERFVRRMREIVEGLDPAGDDVATSA